MAISNDFYYTVDKNPKIGTNEELLNDFTIPKPFTTIDIYNVKPCSDEFIALLKEDWVADWEFKTCTEIKNSPTLVRNITWLASKGFIEKKPAKEFIITLALKAPPGNRAGSVLKVITKLIAESERLRVTHIDEDNYELTLAYKEKLN